MDNQQVTISPIEFGWLIGILDGEGTISAYYRTVRQRRGQHPGKDYDNTYIYPYVGVSNTDREIVERIKQAVQALGENPHIVTMRPKNPKHNIAWRVEVTGMKRLLRFLPKIAFYLTGKKKILADLVLGLCQERLSHTGVHTSTGRGGIKKHGKPLTERERELITTIKALNMRGANRNLRGHTPSTKNGEDMVQALDES